MGLIRGAQIGTGSNGIQTVNLEDNILSASSEGRGKIEDTYFDLDTVTAKFTTSSIPNDYMVDPVLALSGGTMTGDLILFGEPQTDDSAARIRDVNRATQGLDVKESVRLASDANIADTSSITLSDFDGQTQGITLSAGDRVLLKAQSAGAENGLYQVVGTALTRSADANEDAEVTANLFTFVEEGSNADTGWVLTTDDPITIASTALVFAQFTGGGVVFGSPISQVQAGVAADNGTSSNSARSDHTHSAETAAGLGLSATGTNAEGAASAFARSDHDHLVLANVAPQELSLTSSNTIGTNAAFARADHIHSIDNDGVLGGSDGLPKQVATASLPGTALTGARGDHIHESPSWTAQNKGMTAEDTTVNGQGELATDGAIAATALDSYITIKVNGIAYRCGDSSNSASTPAFFSDDVGVTGLDFQTITSGSLCYWNGDIAGFRLKSATDTIDFCYLAYANN